MAHFTVVRLPVLNERGESVAVDRGRVKVAADLRGGFLTVSGPGFHRRLDFGSVVAVDLEGEQRVTDVGRTVGRMALRGAASSMFTRGRTSTVGGGLLDFAVNGTVRRSVTAGTLIWPDTTVVRFSVQGAEEGQLGGALPAGAASPEALNGASQTMDMLERMKADGPRAVQEMAQNVLHLSRERDALIGQVDTGASFAERDGARSSIAEVDRKLSTMRGMTYAMIAETGTTAGAVLVAIGAGQAGAEGLGLGWSQSTASTALPAPGQSRVVTARRSVVAARTSRWPITRVMRIVLALFLLLIDLLSLLVVFPLWFFPPMWILPGVITLLVYLTWPKARNYA